MIESGRRFPELATFLEIDIEAQILIPFGWLNGMPRYHSQMKAKTWYHNPVIQLSKKCYYRVPSSYSIQLILELDSIFSRVYSHYFP